MFPRRFTPQCAEVLPTLKLNFKPVELLERKAGTEVASLMLVVALGLMVLN
jgi:hypothetical protein